MTFDHLLINSTQNQVLATLSLARSFAGRTRGLLARPPIKPDQAFWITPCASIHTLGMGYAIHAVFLDRAGRVLKISSDIAPYRLRFCWGATQVIEVHHRSTICRHVKKGDLITWTTRTTA